MKKLSESEIVLPEFPVYRSFILPYRYGDTEIVDLLEVNEDVVFGWKEMILRLREFLQDSLSYSKSSELSEVEKIELLGDLIVLFLKIPLIRELLPTVVPSPIKSYLIYRFNEALIEEDVEDVFDYLHAFYDRITRENLAQLPIMRYFKDPKLSEVVERCWFRIPADTRPGLNTCGLIPHMLLSSAIAWSLAVDNDLSRERVAIITLAALLHDIGKPINYRDHVGVSRDIADELLKDLLPQEIVNEVVRLIKLHHVSGASIDAEIIRKADRIASRIDRLSSLLKKLLRDELNKLSEETGIDVYQGYEGGGDPWSIWVELYKVNPDAIRELTITSVQKIREVLNDFQVVPRLWEVEDIDGLLMGIVDIGSIQEFIMTSSELRAVAASSLLIDTFTTLFIPIKIQKSTLPSYRIPLGNITYAAGGVVEFIIPEKLYNRISKAVENLNEKMSMIGLPIRMACTKLKDSYPDTILELTREIQLTKLKVDNKKQYVQQNRSREVRELCQICYLRPPELELITSEGVKKGCSICKRLFDIGSEIHFRSRYESVITFDDGYSRTPRDLFKKDWSNISRYILELVAGHDEVELEDLEKKKVEYRNLAVIKFDGNLMGPFMASSTSLADACERSLRIDLALKKALEMAIKKVFDAVREVGGDSEALKTVSQIKLGLIYAGGDDALIFIPSWISIGFALVVGEEFRLNMGGARGLSIGLAVGKSKVDIWALINAASKLMEESKKIGRRKPSNSCICLDISETSTLTGASVVTRLEDLRKRKLTSQPLIFDGEPVSFKHLISLTISEDVEPKNVFKNCYLLSRFGESEIKKKAKNLRRAIAESLNKGRSMGEKVKGLEDYLISLSMIYAHRQSSRKELNEETRKSFEIVTKLCLFKDGSREQLSMYSDADRLIKISGGGAL